MVVEGLDVSKSDGVDQFFLGEFLVVCGHFACKRLQQMNFDGFQLVRRKPKTICVLELLGG